MASFRHNGWELHRISFAKREGTFLQRVTFSYGSRGWVLAKNDIWTPDGLRLSSDWRRYEQWLSPERANEAFKEDAELASSQLVYSHLEDGWDDIPEFSEKELREWLEEELKKP